MCVMSPSWYEVNLCRLRLCRECHAMPMFSLGLVGICLRVVLPLWMSLFCLPVVVL